MSQALAHRKYYNILSAFNDNEYHFFPHIHLVLEIVEKTSIRLANEFIQNVFLSLFFFSCCDPNFIGREKCEVQS